MFPILLASLRAIGVAVTVIVAGILATRFKVLTPPEHSCMSKLSMKVAMPALVFSRILYCNQCADRADCPRCAPFSRDHKIKLDSVSAAFGGSWAWNISRQSSGG